MTAPSRTSLCLRCRSALAPDEPCDVCGDEEVVSLADGAQREEAIAAAWVEEQMPRDTSLSDAARLALLICVPLSLLATVVTFMWVPHAMVLIGGLALACAVLFSPVLVDMYRDAYGFPEPQGELVRRARGCMDRPAMPAAGEAMTGRIVGLGDDDGGRSARAELLELRTSDGAVTLRDAASHGFAVALDDGRRLVVPPGRVRIDVEAGDCSYASVNEAMRRVRILDPQQGRGDDAPIPFEQQVKRRLHDGDRVKVMVPYDESIETDGGYRRAAEVTLTARGVPWIKPLDSH